MLRSRIVPSLLMQDGGLLKTIRFRGGKYVGDPINAVKIFNEKEVDELCLFDIGVEGRVTEPNFNLLEKIAREAAMPLCYGGGVKSVQDAIRLVSMGFEKVSLSSAAIDDPKLIKAVASAIGSQSTVVTLDVKKRKLSKRYSIYTSNGSRKRDVDFLELLKAIESLGAGEIIVNSIDRDGTMTGYDLNLARLVRDAIALPFTMIGGASSSEDMSDLIREVGVVGVGVGSAFVFKGPYKAVLITYERP